MEITPLSDPYALKQDGSTPLTADWDAGQYDIKALSFSIGDNKLTTTEWGYLDSLDQSLATADSPTFVGLTLSGLTASLLVQTNGDKALSSVSDLTAWIAGTGDQITVTDDGDGSVTLSTPQNINTTSSPTFDTLTVTSITIGPDNLDTNEWAYLNGLNQALKTTSSPTFSNLYVDTLTFSSGSITDSSGAISFGNEKLYTTGTLGVGLSGGALTSDMFDVISSGANYIAYFEGNKSGADSGFLVKNDASAGINNSASMRLLLNTGSGPAIGRTCLEFKGNFNPTADGSQTTQGGIYAQNNGSYGLALGISGFDVDVVGDLTAGTIQADNGFTGSWVNNEGDTVTVAGGIITDVS